jgi:hypothetical protein
VARDHRHRILEHQQRLEAELRPSGGRPTDPQLKIPLIGEAMKPEPPAPKRKRQRAKKPVQLRLGGT